MRSKYAMEKGERKSGGPVHVLWTEEEQKQMKVARSRLV